MELANTSPSSSPEFEFWMVGNTPTIHSSQPRILTADELFSDGVLLPLHQLSLLPPPSSTIHHHQQQEQEQEKEARPQTTTNMTKKWKEMMLKVGGDEKKRRIREAELRIHIWPFMRSRSAGRAGLKLEKNSPVSFTRRVSSAPCSRSNSRGEGESENETTTITTTTTTTTTNNNNKISNSVSNRLQGKPKARGSSQVISNNNNNSNSKGSVVGGIHLNRPGLMWKLRRSSRSGGGGGGEEEKGSDGNKKVLNFNVKTCVGYQSGGSNAGLVKLKAFFSKKLH
ncbi:hypothetical protein IHE45_14G098300 [Dioscorea alata]|uniref:Uncharacterized protein n=1 Tax=Dioscorea alata TaxID=55571 RepID=A0ACB7UTT1_DIOAL|nr:hypothetical protein IHE45_14G098300 [Dioscorea alata]